MTPDALAHLANEPGLTLTLTMMGPTMRDDGRWYAAFRGARDDDEDASFGSDGDELAPERGWGYGATPDEAIAAAVADFREQEDEAAR